VEAGGGGGGVAGRRGLPWPRQGQAGCVPLKSAAGAVVPS